jgi:hypothetical protein
MASAQSKYFTTSIMSFFNRIELSPVKFGPDEACVVDDLRLIDPAEHSKIMWGVYALCPNGEAEHIADFNLRMRAEDYITKCLGGVMEAPKS